jgi:serine/threonine protein phosphatase PrpC
MVANDPAARLLAFALGRRDGTPPIEPMSSVAPAFVWSLDGRSVIGASHIRLGMPNQDAIAWLGANESGGSSVLAVSDGHGAVPHFRSEIGARIAVEVATTVLSQALAEPSWLDARDKQRRLGALAQRIIDLWRARVLDHAAANPVSEVGRAKSVRDPLQPYGATLIAAAACDRGIVLLQLGDGDLLVGTTDGSIYRPLPDDEGLIGQQTYSLCLPSAQDKVRTRALSCADYDVDFVMLSTDGLAKSFPDEASFMSVASFWCKTIREAGLSAVAGDIEETLAAAARRGSSDDVTLGLMARSGGARDPLLPAEGRQGEPSAAHSPARSDTGITTAQRTKASWRTIAIRRAWLLAGGAIAALAYALWQTFAP